MNSIEKLVLSFGIFFLLLLTLIGRFGTACKSDYQIYGPEEFKFIVKKKYLNHPRKYIHVFEGEPLIGKSGYYSTIYEEQLSLIEIGDTLTKKSGSMDLFIQKKDTVLTLDYEEATTPLFLKK